MKAHLVLFFSITCQLTFSYVKGNGLYQHANTPADMPTLQSQIDQTDSLYKEGLINTDSAWASYLTIAENFIDLHDFRSARLTIKKSNEILTGQQLDHLLAKNYLLLADLEMEVDDNPSALQILTSVLDIYEGMKDSVNYLGTLKKIGINYDYLGDHETALEYYNECIEMANSLKMPEVVGACYNNIASIMSDEGDHLGGLEYFKKGIEIGKKLNDFTLLSKLYHNMSLTYSDLKMFDEARESLERSATIAREVGDPKEICFSYQGLGFYFLDKGELDSSEYYMNLTLELAQKINNSQLRANAQDVLEEIYYKTGRYKMAYDMFAKSQQEYDSLYNLENAQIIESIKAQYQSEKRDRELAEKNLQLEKASSDLSRKNVLQIALVFVVGLLLIVLFLIYRGFVLRKRAHELLRVRNEEIQAHASHIENLNKTKNRWFINVAHELRTPLTLIKGPVNRVINHFALPEEAKEDLQLVERNANNLSNLVNEILDLSRMEAGMISLNESIFDLCLLVNQVMESFKIRAEHLRLSLHSQCNESLLIRADQEKVRKIIMNLVSNAIKFSESGGTITVIINHTTQGLELSVVDTGKGIDSSDVPFVFDRFFQSSNPSDQISGGTGIGLSLCKEIAELHGGAMSLKSTLGEGSEFILTIPEERIEKQNVPVAAEATELKPEIVEVDLSESMKPILLLVDDNDDIRAYIDRLLSPYFEVKQAQNGIAALDLMEGNDVKFIISDIMMEGMDGIELMRQIKSNTKWSQVPCIHLTALADDYFLSESQRIGIDDYLNKPFAPEELLKRVRSLYDNYLNRSGAKVESDNYDDQFINKLRECVLKHIEETQFNESHLALEMNIAERQLARYLKNSTGLTPREFIEEVKLIKASEWAQNKSYQSVDELAIAVGYLEGSHFSDLYEQRFGKNPSDILRA